MKPSEGPKSINSKPISKLAIAGFIGSLLVFPGFLFFAYMEYQLTLMLTILLVGIGLITCIIAIVTIKKHLLRGMPLAIGGVVISLTFNVIIILFALLANGLSGGFRNNEAQDVTKPIEAELQKLGGKKICDNGDSGYSVSNSIPWYEVYYTVPDSKEISMLLEEASKQTDYPLKESQEYARYLENPDDGYESTFNRESDYLTSINAEDEDSIYNEYGESIYGEGGDSMAAAVYRNIAVPLYCGVEEYGDKMNTAKDSVIVKLEVSLPETDR